MAFLVRSCATLDDLRASSVLWHYLGRQFTDDDAERLNRFVALDRMHVAWDGEEAVGAAGAYGLELSLPGPARAPAAGVTTVAVLPTHRRRRVLTALMRAQLDDVRRRGESIAFLWSSEGPIYGRFGYGVGALAGSLDLPRTATAFAVAGPARPARLVTREQALELFPRVYEEVLGQRPGMFARTPQWWDVRTLAPTRDEDPAPVRFAVIEDGADPVAYAAYRVQQRFDETGAAGVLVVDEALGSTAQATRAIWRFLLDMDWVTRIKASRLPVDHPLLLLAADPRMLGLSVRDGVWVRLVDVRTALSAREYAQPGQLVLELSDEFCPWNAGRWRLADGSAEHTDSEPDLALGIGALASAYLGGFSFRSLADALVVRELVPGAIARADRLFRSERAPWCPEMF